MVALSPATEPQAPTASSESEHWSKLQLLVVGLCFVVNMIDGMDVLVLDGKSRRGILPVQPGGLVLDHRQKSEVVHRRERAGEDALGLQGVGFQLAVRVIQIHATGIASGGLDEIEPREDGIVGSFRDDACG